VQFEQRQIRHGAETLLHQITNTLVRCAQRAKRFVLAAVF